MPHLMNIIAILFKEIQVVWLSKSPVSVMMYNYVFTKLKLTFIDHLTQLLFSTTLQSCLRQQFNVYWKLASLNCLLLCMCLWILVFIL